MPDFRNDSAGIGRRALLQGAAVLGGVAATAGRATARPASLAPTPPMGWNSWNSFATTITEAQALETAAIQARELLPFGYDIFTIDIQWYEPEAASYTYNAKPVPTLDGHGRLLPAPNRFPSAANGKGFAPIAAKVHALGMKFGVHLMRGIPRLAVERNLPVLGANGIGAADIADTSSICPWNPDMYGVDMRKPGAQAYYDSVFAVLASWGVDFVKMDDMSRPYDAHAPEIEAAAKAIKASGRPILLSLSPGETPVPRAEHVARHAQMWRISDDFWDDWKMLEAQFTRLENWSPHARPGAWPDADMLPLGRLALGQRDTKFTPDEQRMLMSLWSIARSPLIMGGDLRHLDAPTRALLTNREVLAVNQASSENRPWFVADDRRVWTARAATGGHYVALFNTGDKPGEAAFDLGLLGAKGAVQVRNLWEAKDEGPGPVRLARTLPPHGAGLYRVTAA
ncbi:glycoside hydrolase family 27 protein [Sphingomonas pituitosa]|uniref:glycoside hydrolase family 27 protein n=1 Tax=Sphingomonas pituitosa TaxID=99597 RepID=UPI000834A7D8|nr:glycoside hydrolase family 27 protein [Sphingomonas pituitosa]